VCGTRVVGRRCSGSVAVGKAGEHCAWTAPQPIATTPSTTATTLSTAHLEDLARRRRGLLVLLGRHVHLRLQHLHLAAVRRKLRDLLHPRAPVVHLAVLHRQPHLLQRSGRLLGQLRLQRGQAGSGRFRQIRAARRAPGALLGARRAAAAHARSPGCRAPAASLAAAAAAPAPAPGPAAACSCAPLPVQSSGPA
jgi:hypothetical protein